MEVSLVQKPQRVRLFLKFVYEISPSRGPITVSFIERPHIEGSTVEHAGTFKFRFRFDALNDEGRPVYYTEGAQPEHSEMLKRYKAGLPSGIADLVGCGFVMGGLADTRMAQIKQIWPKARIITESGSEFEVLGPSGHPDELTPLAV
jgi:hypothetical protein